MSTRVSSEDDAGGDGSDGEGRRQQRERARLLHLGLVHGQPCVRLAGIAPRRPEDDQRREEEHRGRGLRHPLRLRRAEHGAQTDRPEPAISLREPPAFSAEIQRSEGDDDARSRWHLPVGPDAAEWLCVALGREGSGGGGEVPVAKRQRGVGLP